MDWACKSRQDKWKPERERETKATSCCTLGWGDGGSVPLEIQWPNKKKLRLRRVAVDRLIEVKYR